VISKKVSNINSKNYNGNYTIYWNIFPLQSKHAIAKVAL